MRVAIVRSEDASGEFESAIFRVRLWNRPLLDGGAWALDEFELLEARDVVEAIAWAEAQGAASFELAVRWPDSHINAQGSRIERFRYMRVAGQPGDESTTSRVETFFSNC